MKTLSALPLGWLLLSIPHFGQAPPGRFSTKAGRVSFFSSSLIEDIEATNTAAAAVIDLASGQVAFSVPVREFQFRRTLMQEHFNENYLESEKYPRATFAGRWSGTDVAALGTGGAHPVQVVGDLTIHGVKRHISVVGTLELKSGQLLAAASFTVAPADYSIEIPLLVRDHIAKSVQVRVALSCAPADASGLPNLPATPTR